LKYFPLDKVYFALRIVFKKGDIMNKRLLLGVLVVCGQVEAASRVSKASNWSVVRQVVGRAVSKIGNAYKALRYSNPEKAAKRELCKITKDLDKNQKREAEQNKTVQNSKNYYSSFEKPTDAQLGCNYVEESPAEQLNKARLDAAIKVGKEMKFVDRVFHRDAYKQKMKEAIQKANDAKILENDIAEMRRIGKVSGKEYDLSSIDSVKDLPPYDQLAIAQQVNPSALSEGMKLNLKNQFSDEIKTRMGWNKPTVEKTAL
jgi:hypothetical protein